MNQKLLQIKTWIKNNKLSAVLIAIVFLWLFMGTARNATPRLLGGATDNYQNFGAIGSSEFDIMAPAGMSNTKTVSESYRAPTPSYDTPPQPDVVDRKMITTTNMSLKVKDVKATIDDIKLKVKFLGGYVVNQNITTPEYGQSGAITLRIPTDKLDDTLEYFRGLAVKVVSEVTNGSDITDQYIDIQARINRYEKTKAMFGLRLEQAEKIEDILRIQNEIINQQNQIDNYKGKLKYLDGASSTTLISIKLSTDELELPYITSQAWRPVVVFKQAYRAMLKDLIKVGNAGIWFVTYIPVFLTYIFIFLVGRFIIRKIFKKRVEKTDRQV